MNQVEQRKAAKEFAEYWKDKGYEKGQSQPFWLSLLRSVFGIKEPEKYITFESRVKLNNTSFIDGYIDETHVMIEQKSLNKDLSKPILQSDGTALTPAQQAKRYSLELPYSKRPRWIVVSNFNEFRIYDMENPSAEPTIIYLKDLEKEYYRLEFLVNIKSEMLKKEMELSLQAGELVGLLYNALYKQYKTHDEKELKSLNMLCVRLVFCLYAEDAGLFGKHNAFQEFLKSYDEQGARKGLIELFNILNTPFDNRDPYLEPRLASFPYVNGGLFEDQNIIIPLLNQEILDILINKASASFDWSGISPTIFGAVFESTLNAETRRSGGMHYTSLENIHKLIDPLFLDDLKAELEKIKETKYKKTKNQQLDAFQNKLASLTFFDPACGSGNFLTETYISLRRLENEALKEKLGQLTVLGFDGDTNPIKVSLSQFYGIEINDFAVTVAKTALWIAESQMMKETEDIVHAQLDFLPLKSYVNIIEGNSLRIEWRNIIEPTKVNYIIGNPPFVGYKLLTQEQKADLKALFKNMRAIDYVSGWYYKCLEFMQETTIKAALVSTNSIVQGALIQNLWGELYSQFKVHIIFAYKTFIWSSEATEKASVHCVIIGFSACDINKKYIFSDYKKTEVKYISPYLNENPFIPVFRKGLPLCPVPHMTKGAQLIDNGHFTITEEEYQYLTKKYPEIKPYLYLYLNAKSFLNAKSTDPNKYCLYLENCPPNIIKNIPFVMDRVNLVHQYRKNSEAKTTQVLANTPLQFFQSQVPNGNCIVVPVVSSQNRKYIPMAFINKKVVCTNALFYIDYANLYNFGILQSNIHMAWTKLLVGRLKSDFRYSNSIVYNNFPWPTLTNEQRKKIEDTAQAIIDARNLFPDASLAELYNELTMPAALRKAHQANDRAVMQAYGFKISMTESECVAELMKMYQNLTKKLNN